MDLRDGTVVILGGSGLVGHAVARRLLEVPASASSPLRPAKFGLWIQRAVQMVCQAERRRAPTPPPPWGDESGSDVDWTAIEPEDEICPARFATWVFGHEDFGERIKR